MALPPSLELTEHLPDPTQPARHYCTCGLVFEAETEDQAVRLHGKHQSEMRDPAAHQGAPF